MDNAPIARNASRLFLGLVVITLGLAALLDNLGVIAIGSVWRFWPLIFVAVGLARLLRPADQPGRWAGFVFVLIGLWLLLDNLGLMPWRLRDLWPVILLLIGARLVWGAMSRGALRGPAPDSSSRVSAFAMLGASEHRITAPDFRGGDATAVLGGCKIDLRGATVKSGEAVIDAFAMWGGIEIIVPRDWGVVLQGSPILGGFENKNEPAREGSAPRLVVRGVAIMGGVEVKN